MGNSNIKMLASILSTAMIAIGSRSATAQSQGGGIPVRVPNTATHCIDGTKDQVYLTLYRVIVNKQGGWFKTQKSADIILQVQVPTTPALSFPLSDHVNIDGPSFPNGQISIPVEYSLVSGLKLKTVDGQKTTMYNGLNLSITVVNIESATALTDALTALSAATGAKKLPIPSSPITQVGSYLLEFANAAVANSITNHNAAQKLTSDALAMIFDPTGTCAPGTTFEKTGVKAILWADNDLKARDGYVDTGHTNEFCWLAETEPSFVLKATPIVSGKACSDPSYAAKYKTVANNYQAFVLQSVPAAGNLGATSVARTAAINESKRICDALKIKGCPVK